MTRTFTTLLFAVYATLAFAHSPMEKTVPADRATLAKAPTEIHFEFQHNMRLTKVSWKHSDGQSDTLDLTGQKGFTTEFVLPFEGEGSGTYQIEWRGLGADGHPQNGVFSFTVD